MVANGFETSLPYFAIVARKKSRTSNGNKTGWKQLGAIEKIVVLLTTNNNLGLNVDLSIR